MHRPIPEPMQVNQRIARVIDLELDAGVSVFEIQLTTVSSYDGTQHDLEKGEPIELAEGVSI
jgi:hypothetical protein